MIEGWVLRNPRIASSNASTTYEAITLVKDGDKPSYDAAYLSNSSATGREYLVQAASTSDLVVPFDPVNETTTQIDQDGLVYQFNVGSKAFDHSSLIVIPTPDFVDEAAGIVRYNSIPGATPTVTYQRERLSFWYLYNDSVTRFGFDNITQRWSPLPGASPDFLGLLRPELKIPSIKEGVNPRVVIGNPDSDLGTLVPTTLVTDTAYQGFVASPGTIAPNEAVVNETNGNIYFSPLLTSSLENQPTYAFRIDFFSQEESIGVLGVPSDILVLNPIPLYTGPGNHDTPLIRISYDTYLEVLPTLIAVTPTDVDAANVDALWNVNTGRLTLSTSLSAQTETLYYDGVYNTASPVFPQTPQDIGPVVASPGAIPVAFELEEGLVLYVKESGIAIEALRFVNSVSDLRDSNEIPPTEADIELTTRTIRLSESFVRTHTGSTLSVANGDFLFDEGITFRMFRSLSDLSNQSMDISDVRSSTRVVNETLKDGIGPGASLRLGQVPHTNIAGFEEGKFFSLQSGPATRVLEPDVDIIYDFDNYQVLWAEPSTTFATIPIPITSLKLSHEVLHTKNLTASLNTGQGFQPLVEGQDVLVNRDQGIVSFIEQFGTSLFEGFGSGSGTQWIDANTDFSSLLPIDTNPLKRPLLVVGDEVFRIEGITGLDTLDLAGTAPTSNSLAYQVLDAPEVVYLYAFQALDLSERIVFPYVRQTINDGELLPDGETFSFLANGSSVTTQVLEQETLGALEDGGPSLFVPAYYLSPTAQYNLYRDDVLLADGIDYTVNGTTGEITFLFTVADFEGSFIILDPALSIGRTTGPVEVLASTRVVGLPLDLQSQTVEARILIRESSYRFLAPARLIQFQEAFRTGQRLEVEYQTSQGLVTETIGFRIRETITPATGQSSYTITLGTPDTTRPVQAYFNGAPVQTSLVGNEILFPAIPEGRLLTVDYHILEAQGGEVAITLLQDPLNPEVVVESSTTQSFRGDYTSSLATNVIVIFNDEAFTITNVSYDAPSNTTNIVLHRAPSKQMRNPATLGTSLPIEEKEPFVATLDLSRIFETELRFVGDVRGVVEANRLLYVESDPYLITGVTFDASTNLTTAKTQTQLLQEYSTSPALEISTYRVYPEDAFALQTNRQGVITEDFELFQLSNGVGSRLLSGVQYAFEEGGNIVFDPTTMGRPSPPDLYLFAYTGRRIIGPTLIQGQLYTPQFQASYTRRVNATTDNGFLHGILRGSYTFASPDSFYFRVVSLEDFAGEVSQSITRDVEAALASTGPQFSFLGSRPLQEQGSLSLRGAIADAYDRDRVGRFFISFYNDTISKMEEALEIVDGRVVGDRDGKFLFEIRTSGPGSEDPYTGKIIPYYVNSQNPGVKPTPAEIDIIDLNLQVGEVRNFIDDILLTSKKPEELTFTTTFPFVSLAYQGTFQIAGRPSAYSRFFPERRDVFTITAPSQTGSAYSFGEDFGLILADLRHESLLSVDDIKPRYAKGRLIVEEVEVLGAQVRLQVGMLYDANGDILNDPLTGSLERGKAELYIPPYQVGDHVHLARVVYTKTANGFDRTETLYATHMIVDAVDDVTNTITLGNNPFVAQHPDLVATDVLTLDPANNTPIAGYGASLLDPKRGDTLFGFVPQMVDTGALSAYDDNNPPPFYRNPVDLGIDASGGELVNRKLPDFASSLVGQASPLPLTFLDATLKTKNQNVAPIRFPALDGAEVDDNGDNKPPYVFPFEDSEYQRLPLEEDRIQEVFSQTDEGYVFATTVSDFHTIDTPVDVTSDTDVLDLLVIEGETTGPNLTPFRITNRFSNRVEIAAYTYAETGVSYQIANLLSGTGSSTGITTWTDDGGFDFTAFSGANTLTITVNTVTYTVVGLAIGSLTTSVAIPATPPGTPYVISLDSVGDIATDLYTLSEAGVDFSNATGDLVILSGFNAGTYPIDVGVVGSLTVESLPFGTTTPVTVGISSGVQVQTGTGAVILPNIFETTASLVNVDVGMQLTVDDVTSPNAGRYTIASITGNQITINETFRINEGLSGGPYPVSFLVKSPRRGSLQLEAWKDTLISLRPLYEDNTSAPVDLQPILTASINNPVAPYRPVLECLQDLLNTEILDVPTGSVDFDTGFGQHVFRGPFDFTLTVEEGDYVLVEGETLRGFYKIIQVDPLALVISETNTFTTYTLSPEPSVPFKVYRPSEFLGDRTHELVYYELFFVLDQLSYIDERLRAIEEDVNDLEGPTGIERPGDPSDTFLINALNQIIARLQWIRDGSPNLIREIEGALKGSESLYDLRYAWIDFRLNLSRGSLANIQQQEASFLERLAQLRRDLLKLRNA